MRATWHCICQCGLTNAQNSNDFTNGLTNDNRLVGARWAMLPQLSAGYVRWPLYVTINFVSRPHCLPHIDRSLFAPCLIQ